MHPLYLILKQVQTESEFQEILNITLTEKEQAMILERWQILSALDKGHSQREVAKKVDCSVVTVTRGAKAYRDNKTSIQKWLKIIQAQNEQS